MGGNLLLTYLLMKKQFSVLIYQEVSIFDLKKRQTVLALHSLKWINLKACAFYFSTNFYLSPNDSPSKTMKDAFYFI